MLEMELMAPGRSVSSQSLSHLSSTNCLALSRPSTLISAFLVEYFYRVFGHSCYLVSALFRDRVLLCSTGWSPGHSHPPALKLNSMCPTFHWGVGGTM